MPLVKIQYPTENPIYLDRKVKVLRLLERYDIHGNILDLGCSYGSYSLVFAQTHGNVVTAVDQDAQRIQILKQSAKDLGVAERMRCAVCQIEEWDTTVKFDAVILNYVMYLIDKNSHEKIVRRASRFLKKDGIFLLVEATPSPPKTFQPLKQWFSALNWSWCGRDLPQLRSSSDWVGLADRSGLELLETQYEDGWWTCLISRVGEAIRARATGIWCAAILTRTSTSSNSVSNATMDKAPSLCVSTGSKKYNVLVWFMRLTNVINRIFPRWATQIHIFRQGESNAITRIQ